MDTQEILNLQEAYMNVYSSYELDEEEADRLRDRRAEAGAHWGGGNDPEPRRPSSGTAKPQTAAEREAAAKKHREASDAAFASVVADLKKKYGDNAVISGMRTRKPGGSVSEATAMAKRGYDEAPIRQKIAQSTGGGQAADRATALSKQSTFGDTKKQTARDRYAATQRGDFRRTTSSNQNTLLGYGFKSNDPAVKAKQAARGAQRSALTPKEKQQLNREEFELYDIVLSHLLDEGYADTVDSAEVIMDNMSEEWVDDILEAKIDAVRTRGMNPDQAKRFKQMDRMERNQPRHPGTHTPRMDTRAPEHQASRGVRGSDSRNKQILNRENPKPGNYSQMQSDNPVERGRSIAHGKRDVASRRSARQYIQKALDDAGIQRSKLP